MGLWWCIDQRVVHLGNGLHPCLYISLSWYLMCHTSSAYMHLVEIWMPIYHCGTTPGNLLSSMCCATADTCTSSDTSAFLGSIRRCCTRLQNKAWQLDCADRGGWEVWMRRVRKAGQEMQGLLGVNITQAVLNMIIKQSMAT